MRIFSTEYFNEKTIEQIKKEEHVYFSKKFDCILVTNNVYEFLVNKYNITNDDDLEDEKYNFTEYIHDDIEQWIDWYFMDEEAEFFGECLYLTNYAECVRLDIEDSINEQTGEITFITDDWGINIEKILKDEVSIGFKIKLEEEVERFIEEGYNLGIVARGFTEAIVMKKQRVDIK